MVPFPCPVPSPPRHRRSETLARTPSSYPVAVGRDVPIAPPRHGAVRGLASRSLAPHPRAPRDHTLARPVTTPSPAPVAIPQTHYPCGAMGTSHPTALTPAVAHRHPRNSHAPPRCPFHGFQHATLENLQRRCGGSPLLAGHPGLFVPIHPVPSLFVFLCVKNTRPPRCAPRSRA